MDSSTRTPSSSCHQHLFPGLRSDFTIHFQFLQVLEDFYCFLGDRAEFTVRSLAPGDDSPAAGINNRARKLRPDFLLMIILFLPAADQMRCYY